MEDDRPKSRTLKKREDRALQRLGEQLLDLSADELAAIRMPEELAEAVRLGRAASRHGARRRQLQYIGVLMRHIDAEPIRAALDRRRRGDDHQKAIFKKLERWRDALKRGDILVVEDILADCPGAQRQQLLTLADKARQATGTQQAIKASRELFRYLRAACEETIS